MKHFLTFGLLALMLIRQLEAQQIRNAQPSASAVQKDRLVTNSIVKINDMSYTKRTYIYKSEGEWTTTGPDSSRNALFPVLSPRRTPPSVVEHCDIKADVFRVADNVVRPVIFWIHGGALISGHRGNLHSEQLGKYLEAGYAIVSIDYRLAPETKLKLIIEDLQDAYKWVRTSGPNLFQIDPNRIAVIGHSAGGYLTLMAGFCLEPRPKALVSFYGYGDIAGEWYSRPDPFYSQRPAVPKQEAYQAVGGAVVSEGTNSQRGRFYLYCRQHGLWPKEVAGHDPDKEPRAFDPFCPIRNVTKTYPPTMLLHGDNDTDVPFEQSVMMDKELERKQVEHVFIPIKGGGHGFDRANGGLKDSANREVFDRVLTFLKKHLEKPTP